MNGLKYILLTKPNLPTNNGKNNNTHKAITNKIKPTNLSGTDLKIAYNPKKYHSGTI